MRVMLATTGSEGDVRPFLALAEGLRARGHQVTLFANSIYGEMSARYGIPFESLRPEWGPDVLRDTFARILSESNPVKQLAIVIESASVVSRESLPKFLEQVPAFDVVVYHPLLVAALAAARAKGVRHASVQLAPLHPADGYSPTGANLGVLLNRFMWWGAKRMIRGASDAALNETVVMAGLEPWRDVMLCASASELLDLVAVSPKVVARDPAWPKSSQLTGFWFTEDEAYEPDAEFEAFLRRQGDKKPIVIGFGSMHGFDTAKLSATILEAVRTLEHPVVVQSGWAELALASVPPHVIVTKYVPHAWLFARAHAVVHHGGAGTTAACFRAGVPQAIVWHLGDQPVWGRHVARLGVGPSPIAARGLTAKALRSALDALLVDGAIGGVMATKARALAEEIRAERGVDTAVRAIEQLQ
jgi:UDP:flavonoid glycosyltransferase YjiC (YdhE family)